MGPYGIIICFIIYLVWRDNQKEKNGNGTDQATLQSLANTQETMAHTIGLIEDHGSVPFQVYVAANEERLKHVEDSVDDLQKHTKDQSDRLDVIADGSSMTRQILNSVIDAHNRIHPDKPVYGSGGSNG